MCSRPLAAIAVCALLLLAHRTEAQSTSAQRVSLGLVAARVDFAREIRFDDGNAIGMQALARLRPWWQLGLQFDRVSARDRELDRWQSLLVASIQSRLVGRPHEGWSPTLGIGVSFMGFEEYESVDAVAEGLDLSLGLRWRLDSRWSLDAELLSRMQSFNVESADPVGGSSGEREQTNYRWTRVLQVGLNRAF